MFGRTSPSFARSQFCEPEVRAIIVVVRGEAGEKALQGFSVEGDGVVEQIAASRRDEAFGSAVLPGPPAVICFAPVPMRRIAAGTS